MGNPENKNAGTDCSVVLRNYSVLEGERDAATHQTEVIFRPIHHVPTEIVHPADVRGDANFDAAAKLANRFGATTLVPRPENLKPLTESVRTFASNREPIPLPATENRTSAGEYVGCKTRAWKWIS